MLPRSAPVLPAGRTPSPLRAPWLRFRYRLPPPAGTQFIREGGSSVPAFRGYSTRFLSALAAVFGIVAAR